MTAPDQTTPGFDAAAALTTAAFGVAAAIGIGAAFVGLDSASLWQDELYTAWIVDPAIGLRETSARALRDVGPPLYYVLLWPVAQVLGATEIGVRLFSVLCAIGAVVLFVAGGRPFFSLRARLFAAAMATGSSYWFIQSQNARFYALGMLVSTALLLLALSALERPRVSRSTIGLFAATAIATLIHFYLFYISMAVLAVLFLLRPAQRVATAGWAAFLLVVAVTYLKLVIEPHSYAAIGANWLRNDTAWYAEHLRIALQHTLTNKAAMALALCLLPGCVALVRTRRLPPGSPVPIVLCLAVPLLVLLAGSVSSLLFTPNFHSRYLLLTLPFLWGLFALLYDRSVAAAPRGLRLAVDAGLVVLLLWIAETAALNRFKPYTEPFRESAARIAAIPACQGQEILAVILERRSWFRSDEGVEPIRAAYARYLGNHASVRTVFFEDLVAGSMTDDTRRLLTDRIDGKGCPVLAWTVHLATPQTAAEIGKAILVVTDRAARAPDLETIAISTGLDGFILKMRR